MHACRTHQRPPALTRLAHTRFIPSLPALMQGGRFFAAGLHADNVTSGAVERLVLAEARVDGRCHMPQSLWGMATS